MFSGKRRKELEDNIQILRNKLEAIKSNSRLLEIDQCNPYYDGLTLQIKEQFSHRRKGEGLDVEAIYFQACQALDYPSGPDDILWAKAQFMKISGYKDADQRVSECNRKIAGA